MIVLQDARVIYILWEHNEIIRQCLEYLIAKGYIVDHENELMDEIKQIIFWCEKLKLTVIEINVISKKKIPLSEGIERIRKIINSIYTKEIGFYSKLYYLLKQD